MPHRHHAFDSSIGSATAWLDEVAMRLALPRSDERRALRALRAGLHAIRDRLPAHEVIDLGAQLPTLIRGIYYDGWMLDNDPSKIRGRAALYERVRRELGKDPTLDAHDVLAAVIGVLHAHVSRGELDDIIATLPKPLATLWRSALDHDVRPIELAARGLTRRTGYSR